MYQNSQDEEKGKQKNKELKMGHARTLEHYYKTKLMTHGHRR
jgi:hypothetical protein